jgi:NitT/TauT family transport system permease protein
MAVPLTAFRGRRKIPAWYLRSALPFVFLALVWSGLTYGDVVDRVFLPTPGEVIARLMGLLNAVFLREYLVPSVVRVMTAFLLSAAIAFPLGVLSSQVLLVKQMVHPVAAFSRYLPVAAFVPLCILWFGIDDAQKVAVIMLGVVFQLILLVAVDTSSVPQEMIETGRTFGLSRYQVLRRIVIPWSMPAIWDDLRISAGWAWSYLVLAELVAGNRGVGYFIAQSQRYLDTDKVFAGVLFIGFLGILTDWAFRFAGWRLFRWA